MSATHVTAGFQAESNSEPTNSVKIATKLLNRLSWLAPLARLNITNGSVFGRQIEQSLRDLKEQRGGVLSINVRNQQAAVVMSIEHYEELLTMKEACVNLVKEQRRLQLEALGDEFDHLYQLMQRPEHKIATEAFFNATAEDLNSTYRPGRTETSE